MCRETVAKGVWAYALAHLRMNRYTPQHGESHLTAESSALTSQKEDVFMAFHGDDFRTVLSQIIIYSLQRRGSNGNDSFFVSFADYLHYTVDEIDFG